MQQAQLENYFSKVAVAYARFRPTYPHQLFELVDGYARAHDRAWDCATGSGQAAVGLSPHFREVLATDVSAEQIQRATPASNIVYRVAPAEDSGIAPASVDAITVAEALHLFDLERFYTEVRRVCGRGAVIAIWFFVGSEISFSEDIDRAMHRLETDIFQRYRAPEALQIRDFYSSMTFPFEELPHPSLDLHVEWTVDNLIRIIGTASATRRCIAMGGGEERLRAVINESAEAWGDPSARRHGSTNLLVRIGRISQ